MHLHVLIQRLFLTAVAALIVVAVARWLINPPDSIWVLHRRVQLLWLGSLFTWSLLVRFGLRRGLVFPEPPQLLLLADNSEADIIQRAWKRVPQLSGLRRVTLEQLKSRLQGANERCLITVGLGTRERIRHLSSFKQLEGLDPRRVQVVLPAGLFERQQERLPPILLADSWMSYDEMPGRSLDYKPR